MTGQELKQLRTQVFKMSQRELAKELGVRRETIVSWEKGKHQMIFRYERAIDALMELNKK